VPNGFVVTLSRGSNEGSGFPDCNGNSFGSGIRHRIMELPSSGTSSIQICGNLNDGTPEGFVVIRSADDTSDICSGPIHTIRRPSSSGTTVICPQTTNIPTGYVVTSNSDFTSSCGIFSRSLDIRIPSASSSTLICSNLSLVPDGFAILSDGNVSQCGGSQSSGPSIRIGIPSNGDIVCGGTTGTAPGGFLRGPNVANSQCDNSSGFRVIQISQISGSQAYCTVGNDVPPGFVVTGIRSSSASGCPAIELTIRTPSTSGSTVTCDGFPIPLGFGVVGTGNSSNCTSIGASGVTSTIAPIQAGNSFCDDTGSFTVPSGLVISRVETSGICPTNLRVTLDNPNPNGGGICVRPDIAISGQIPTGYVITATDASDSRCAGARNRVSIRLPSATSDTFICAISPVPSGFSAIRGNITTSQCDGLNGSVIRPLSVTNPNTVCVGSPIPDGFVITAFDLNSSLCGLLGAQTVTAVTSPITVCFDSPIPDGYVKLRYLQNFSACQDFGPFFDNAVTIALPNSTGTTLTCSAAPAGFSVIATQPSSVCLSQGFANLIRADGDILPSTFVSPIRNVDPANVPSVSNDCGGASQTGGFLSGQPRNSSACP